MSGWEMSNTLLPGHSQLLLNWPQHGYLFVSRLLSGSEFQHHINHKGNAARPSPSNYNKMSFIGELLEGAIGGGGNDRRDEAPMDPPYVQPPWVTRWDDEYGRWIFINEQTGERSFERPIFEEAGE